MYSDQLKPEDVIMVLFIGGCIIAALLLEWRQRRHKRQVEERHRQEYLRTRIKINRDETE